MNVRFVAPNPRQRAKPILDLMLAEGTEQIAIACAFLTGGGVELLKRHVPRLRLEPSFVVVAWEYPTSLEALEELHALIPGKVYVHLGALTPVEKGVGSGLMHSKVYFAKAGRQCWLWTGSHNLTASAAQGVNCEAAILIEGTDDDSIFGEAIAHLNQCRTEAIPYDPRNPPPPHSPEQTLVIHAECGIALQPGTWFIHLRPASTDYDKAMRPPGAAWLYLYNPGSLRVGHPRPKAREAYSGVITALNFTDNHPQFRGIPAGWRDATYVIEIDRGIPRFTETTPHTFTPSQGVIRIETREDPATIWLTESPEAKLERVVGVTRISEVDPEYRKFFSKQSVVPDGLLNQEYRSIRTAVRVSRKEIGDVGESDLQVRLKGIETAAYVVDESLKADDKNEFIYRAKFRA